MARTRYFVFCTSVGMAAVIFCGCQDRSGPPSQAAAPAKLTPEEKFELIVDTFRRGVEDIPIGFAMQESSGSTVLTGKSEVTHELIPPTNEGDPYRGMIKVTTQSRYSMERTKQPENAKSQKSGAGKKSNQFSPLAEDQAGVDILDRDLVSTPSTSGQKQSRSPSSSETPQRSVAQQSDEFEREYELVYKGDKWELVTKLDPQTEQAIQNAFRHALETQS